MSSRRRRLVAGIGGGVLLAVGLYYGGRIAVDLTTTATDLHETAHVGSDSCEPCHADNHRSFSRTFHGRMTREADDETVLGEFDGRTLLYGGVLATMGRDGDGRFSMVFDGPGFAHREVHVARTVGSHRYQQYLAKIDDLYVRLPIAWDPLEARFFHMNGAFLTPDPEPPAAGASISVDDYDRHVVRWNDNCVFCHNVAPNPGLVGERFETEVAELGVACEACHGPGERHLDARRDALRSLSLDVFGDDPTIVSPEDLSAARSAEVCGRCHGQRKTDDLPSFLANGDPFVPGDRLSEYSEPLSRTTPLDGDETVFASRFWRDGTPRLTAYALQGWLMSPCTAGDELTCTTCHGMHEGDPDGQLRPEALGDGACIDCHQALGEDAALEAHAHHPPSSAGARCVACHMPKIVYGLVGARISHRIEVPSPAAAERAGRPDACTLCHVDRSRAWAVREVARLWGRDGATPVPRDDALPEVLRALFGGDPIERAIAADALGQRRRATSDATRGARLGALFDVMKEDAYPAIRHIAWRSARALSDAPDAPWQAYVATDQQDEREAAIEALTALSGVIVAPASDIVEPLRDQAAGEAIHIGE